MTSSLQIGQINSPRRYALVRRRRAVEDRSDWASVWWDEQRHYAGTAIPDGTPGKATLASYGYVAWEDVDGASWQELKALGLKEPTAQWLIRAAALTLQREMVRMGYTMLNGQRAETEAVTLATSAARTETGNGSAVEVGDARCGRITLTATAVSGTSPSAVVTVQGSQSSDFGTPVTLATFTTVSAPTAETKLCALMRYIRAAWAITGDGVGSVGATTKTGVGPAVTIAGTPDAARSFVIEIQTTGHTEVATFRWSKNGGTDWDESSVTVPVQASPYALGSTGCTATFTTSTVGANGAITEGGGGDPPDLTLSGEPAGAYQFKIEITTTGGRDAGAFNWSTDNGATWQLATPKTIAANGVEALGSTGVTATFADAEHTDGQTYAWTSTAPLKYTDDTTYTATATGPAPDTSATFSVAGEVC